MNTYKYQTIIIGGGISGLSCASALHNHKKDFLLITENIGGRILSSNKGNVNYGAYYVTKDYTHLLPFIEIIDKISPFRVLFHRRKQTYHFMTLRFFSHSFQLLKLFFYLYKFRRHYNKFKKECLFLSQKEALRQDPYLYHLYNQTALSFIEQKGLKEITSDYLAEGLSGTTFLPIKKHSAFTFLHFCLPIVISTYLFTFRKEKFIEGFKDKITFDTVVQIRRIKKGYALLTKKGRKLYAKYVVVATPPLNTQKLLPLKKIKPPVCVHMFHIKGKIKGTDNTWQESVFMPTHNIFVIAKQPDNTYLLYSKEKNPPFFSYFSEYKIIKHVYWNPAFHLEGTALLDAEYSPNLYIAGDHNLCGMEDSFISGLFAAKKIVEKR